MSESKGKSCRHAFTESLLEMARGDESIIAVTSDAKGSVTLGDFEKELPEQFLEMGIAEQNTVGVAAGLARCGRRPFVCGPACFYSARAIEQVKNDVAYADTNVKIVGVSGGVSYGALGSTHHSLHDIAFMRAIPNMSIILPCDIYQTEAATRFLASHVGPVYMRLGRGAVPSVYSGVEGSFVFGRANTLREGGDCTIIATGEMVYQATVAAQELGSRGIEARVLDFPTLKPLDTIAIKLAAEETGAIITIEEHSIYGGLGAAVAEVVVQNHPVPMKILGFPDEFVPSGSSAELFDYYGLTAPKLAESIELFLEGSRVHRMSR
ncbi:MAG TPA: transketolase family protein [Spirochaetia bacterium]|nr:transketolase family protein [Spirochaetia bacterium]